MRSAALILAAGGSTRMRGGHKPLMRLGGKPLVRWVAEAAASSKCEEVYVVVGCRGEEVAAALQSNVRIILNDEWEEGMSASIRRGVSALEGDVEAAVILLADQPFITSRTIDMLLSKLEEGFGIAYSSVSGEVRSPAAFRRRYFGELRGLTGDVGARGVVERNRSDAAAVDVDPGELLDVDTQEDLRLAEERLARRRRRS